MRRLTLFCLVMAVLASTTTNALAVRELWYTMKDQVDVWDTSGSRLASLAVPLIAGADIALATGIVQNPVNGEVLVAVRYHEADWDPVGNRLLRYEASSAGDGDYDYLGEAGTLSATPYAMSVGDDGKIYYAGNYQNIYSINPTTYAETYHLTDVSGTHDIAVSNGVAYLGRYNYPQSVRCFRTSDWARLDDLYDENPASPTYQQGGAAGVQIVDGKLYVADYARKIWEWDVTGGPGTFSALTPTLIYNGSNGPDGQTLEKNGQLRWNDEDEWFSSEWASDAPGPYVRTFYYDVSGSQWRYREPPGNVAYDIDSQTYGAYHAFVDPNYTGAPTHNPGDVNGDLFVGGADLTKIIDNWGLSPADWADGDIDPFDAGDDFIGGADYTQVLDNWGNSYAPEAVPEPASLLLLGLGVLGSLIRRR